MQQVQKIYNNQCPFDEHDLILPRFLNKQKNTNNISSVKTSLMEPLFKPQPLKKIFTLIMGLFFSIALLACQSGPEQTKGPDKKNAPATTNSMTDKKKEADQMPDLRLEDASGKVVQISNLKGKVIFINFWATWCAPCREEMPTINKLRAHFKDNKDIIFLMVDVDGKVEASSKYVKNKGYDLPVYKAAGAIAPQYLGQAIPTTIILDKQGVLAARIEGAMDYGTTEVVEAINKLINK